MAVNPDCFLGRDLFAAQVENHASYIKSAKPAEGFKEVLLPGEFEFNTARRRREKGIDIPDATWSGIVEIASSLGCDWVREFPVQKRKNGFVHY